jgi:N-methylhydantoinase A
MFKASTTPGDPVGGMLDALSLAADAFGLGLQGLLARSDMFIYGTTHALNAVLTGKTARTAFLCTRGHPDVLVLREGGRADSFDFAVPYPEPYVKRSLTWEIGGRVLADGSEREAFDEPSVLRAIEEMKALDIQAVGVSFLWSIVNPVHELRVGAMLDEHLPGVAYTLSHQVNPCLREYRRASSACIDASLKPMMTAYLRTLERRLNEAGFSGRTLVVTSQGGVMDAAAAATMPITLLNSGPSMAPVAGRYFALTDEGLDTAIVADTGGTTYDVSLVRRATIPWTREAWIGQPYRGHMTGFPSVDVTSVGAGGGSIAWVDDGGMLRVGPQSAGSFPGPVCYGRGGVQPTLTDACVALGYIDPEFFLGGAISLDRNASVQALFRHVAGPLDLTVEDAAAAIVELATEAMVQAILEICVNQGIDPASAVLIGGGGAAGLNSVLIARRLQSPGLLIPQVGAAMSAAGAMMSDLRSRFQTLFFTDSRRFDFERVNAALEQLRAQCDEFVAKAGPGAISHRLHFWVEARYADQVWEIDVPLEETSINTTDDLASLVEHFHMAHEQLFAVRDEASAIEFVSWGVEVACRIRESEQLLLAKPADVPGGAPMRKAYFAGHGTLDTQVVRFESLRQGDVVDGPALVESPFTTVVVNPGATVRRRASGSLAITPGSAMRTRT